MNHLIIISTFGFLVLVSCNNHQTNDRQQSETPKALDDDNLYESSFKRSYNDDLVEKLYTELADKTPELKELEIKIDNLSKSKRDSTEVFDKYNKKNQSYYNAAGAHMSQIKDSVLRDKMKTLIALSLAKYEAKNLQNTDLLKTIESKTLTLNDLHTIIKITRTMDLMAKYQTDNLPNIKSLEGFSKQLDKTINYADTLSKR